MTTNQASTQAYAELHTAAEPPLLAQLTRETHLQVLMPRMSSGHLQGRLLSLLSHLVRPRRVLEIGAFCGYATLCLAEGLGADGVLHTIEIDPEREARIRRYVAAVALRRRCGCTSARRSMFCRAWSMKCGTWSLLTPISGVMTLILKQLLSRYVPAGCSSSITCCGVAKCCPNTC